jgi:hypothetical protein
VRLPIYRVATGFIARGISAAFAAGLAAAVLLSISASFADIDFLFLFLMAGVGYDIEEVVAANRGAA